MPQLIFFRDQKAFFHVRLQTSSTKIGRSGQNDVVLEDPEVSREQAMIFMSEGHFFIKNLGQNKIRINDQEVESHALRDQDKIQIGPWAVLFQGSLSAAEEGEATQLSQAIVGKTQTVASGSRGILVQDLGLRVQGPDQETFLIPLTAHQVTLGAGSQNDIVLEDPYISSRHLKVVVQEGRIWVYDLGSTNGTQINGVKIREAELELGGILQIGKYQIMLQDQGKVEEVRPIETETFCGLVGASSPMQKLYGVINQVGPTEATVLILGESGSGKELVSQAVHQLSARALGPLVAINCGAIAKDLIESELFGHEKGAFTGAANRREGAFGLASGGTLFLDEIGELPLELQPKLLRVLENKTYRRVGGQEELRTDVRIVAATHRDLATLVKEKKFREDLFFRLFVLPIIVPALRDHREDIPLLADTFLREFSPAGVSKTLSPKAMGKLKAHSFPGNIREFRNILMRSVFLSGQKEIQAEDILFPENLTRPSPEEFIFSGIEKLEDMEKNLVLKALMAHDWNKARAAESLGIAKSTLFSKIKLYDLESESPLAS